MIAIAGVLILVIAIGTTMLQQVSRQRYLEAHMASRAEVALNLAESGRNMAMEILRETGLVPGTVLFEELIRRLMEDGETTEIPLTPAVLEELAADLDPESEVAVTMTLREEGPLLPASGLRGILRDPREKEAALIVRSSATFLGVTRTLIAESRIRMVRVTAPVVSKFTLFLGTTGGQELNLLGMERAGAGTLKMGSGAGAPLVLHNRTERFPAILDGRFDPLGPLFSSMAMDAHGLVHLGGDEPWVLNLSHGVGGGKYEELFHLRRTRYAYPSAVGGVSTETGLLFGFHDGVLGGAPFAGGTPQRAAELGGGRVPDKVAALRLFGDVTDVSPTVVLGPVYRSYLRLIALDGLWYPYRRSGTAGGFPGSADDYQRVMAQVVADPYNWSVDFMATNQETWMEGGRVGGAGTPFAPRPGLVPDVLARIQPLDGGDRAFLYPEPGAGDGGAVQLLRLMQGGDAEPLFEGTLSDLDGPTMEEALLRKVTTRVDDADAFLARFAPGNVVDTDGVILVRAGEVVLPGLAVGRPSMVLVEGSVALTGPIGRVEGAPLTIVSLGGDIRVETSDRIEAALVAMRGQVTMRGAVDLVGGIAAQTLDFATLAAGAGPKDLRYDEGLDPTHEETYWKHFRIWTSPVVRLAVEGG